MLYIVLSLDRERLCLKRFFYTEFMLILYTIPHHELKFNVSNTGHYSNRLLVTHPHIPAALQLNSSGKYKLL